MVPRPPGAPGVLQDKEVHSQLHQVSLHGFSGHAAVHGVDQLGSLSVGKQKYSSVTMQDKDDNFSHILCSRTADR